MGCRERRANNLSTIPDSPSTTNQNVPCAGWTSETYQLYFNTTAFLVVPVTRSSIPVYGLLLVLLPLSFPLCSRSEKLGLRPRQKRPCFSAITQAGQQHSIEDRTHQLLLHLLLLLCTNAAVTAMVRHSGRPPSQHQRQQQLQQ